MNTSLPIITMPTYKYITPYNYHANIWIHHLSTITMPTYEYTTFPLIPCQYMNTPPFYNYHANTWIHHSLLLQCQHMNTSLPTITMPTHEYITPYNYLASIWIQLVFLQNAIISACIATPLFTLQTSANRFTCLQVPCKHCIYHFSVVNMDIYKHVHISLISS